MVEDQTALRELIAEALGELGYDVLTAGGAPAALDLAGAHPGAIDLLLTLM